jgi:hypothetical protein
MYTNLIAIPLRIQLCTTDHAGPRAVHVAHHDMVGLEVYNPFFLQSILFKIHSFETLYCLKFVVCWMPPHHDLDAMFDCLGPLRPRLVRVSLCIGDFSALDIG